MTLAAETRAAVRRHPFLHDALRAGVLNYAAAARLLDVEGDDSAVVAALRRYAETLSPYAESARDARVTMRSGLGGRSTRSVGGHREKSGNDREAEALLHVGDREFVPNAGALTGVLVTGSVDAVVLYRVLERFGVEGIDPVAAGVAGNTLVLVVSRRDGPTAVRVAEAVLDAVPE